MPSLSIPLHALLARPVGGIQSSTRRAAPQVARLLAGWLAGMFTGWGLAGAAPAAPHAEQLSAWFQQGDCLRQGGSLAVALSGDGAWLAVQQVAGDPTEPREWFHAMPATPQGQARMACSPVSPPQQEDDNGLIATALAIGRDGQVLALGGRGRPVQIMTRQAERWTQASAITPVAGPGDPGPGWGTAVALSADGNLLVVADQGATTQGLDGALYAVQRRTDGAWDAPMAVTWPGMPRRGMLSDVMALSADGQTLAVSLHNDSDRVFVLRRQGTGWRSVASLRQPLTGGRLTLALALSADGQWLAVGSGGPGLEDYFNGPRPPGQAAVYRLGGPQPVLHQRLHGQAARPGDHFAQQLRFDQAGHLWVLDASRGRACRHSLSGTATRPICSRAQTTPSPHGRVPVHADSFDVSDDGRLVLMGSSRAAPGGMLWLLRWR